MRLMTRGWLATAFLLVALVLPSQAQQAPPTTGFEQNGGANWTTHAEELAFLDAVAAGSERVALSEIGRTLEDRPLHLVEIGAPGPHSLEPEPIERPTVLFVCTQHGNEPAGREACLEWLRDLAFTTDPTLVRQLEEQTILFVPTANPDGRAANTRGNADGNDINRDHLNLETPEAQAIAAIVRDRKPDAVVDLHEFGATPGVYDDEILYLWPRNLNVDPQVRQAAKTLAEEYVATGARANGQRAGEYGRQRVPVFDYHISQTAGDEDEGIARNLFGLRHAAGLLLETRVGGDPRTGLEDMTTTAVRQNRRVDTHVQAVADTLSYMRDHGPTVQFVNESSASRKTREGAEQSAPIYFDGQDDDGTIQGNGDADPTVVADPPPCGYNLSEAQLNEVSIAFLLHGVSYSLLPEGGAFVSLAQPAEPVIPLLVDDRGRRNAIGADPVMAC